EVDAAVYPQDVVLNVHHQVLLLNARHLHHDGEGLVGLVDVGVWDVVTARDRLLLLGGELLLLADRHLLALSHGLALVCRLLGHALIRSRWSWPSRSRRAAGRARECHRDIPPLRRPG